MSVQDMIFNEEVFFNNKPIKIITELITTLDKVVNLVEVQPASNFEDIQLEEDKEFLVDVSEDLINVDNFKDNVKDE